MIKKLLFCLLICAPSICSAQTEATLKKDYAKDVHNMVGPLRWDDNTNVIAINEEKNTVTISAIGSNMQEAWTTSVPGYALSISKFKGKILVVSAPAWKRFQAMTTDASYMGYLLDSRTGKVMLQKELYGGHLDLVEFPHFFSANDGSFFKLVVRKTNMDTKKHYENLFFPVALFNVGRMMSKVKETTDITTMDFDDQLNPINIYHLGAKDDAAFVDMTCNSEGSLFVSWYTNGNISMAKYPYSKKESSLQISESFDLHKKADAYFTFYPSIKEPNLIYMTITYKNPDNDPELTVSKLDFTKNTIYPITEVFTNKHLKELVKGFIPVNKKLDKPFDLVGKYCAVKLIVEQNDRLLVFLSSAYTTTSTSTLAAGSSSSYTFAHEGSLLINGYDLKLNPLYYQFFPSGYDIQGGTFLDPGFNSTGNTLNLIADLKKDGTLSGTLDVATGAWNDMYLLPKKKLSSTDFPQADQIMWYVNGFIIPYTRQRGWTKTNQDISLQQFTN